MVSLLKVSKLRLRRGFASRCASAQFGLPWAQTLFKGMIRETRGLELEAEQILDKVILFSTGQAQVHACVVVIDDRIQISETAVVIETTFEVCGKRADGRSAITHIGSATGLKAVDADVAGLMKIPSRLRPERFDMTVVASSLAAEQLISTRSRNLVERYRCVRCRNRELIELQSSQL